MNEAYLIQLAQRGSQDAFTEIFNRYRQPLYYFILRRVHNETDAEDLVMESFERAFTGINDYINQDKFGGWLHVIAKNRIIDFLRLKKITPHTTELNHTIKDILTPEIICIYNQEYGIIQEGIRAFKNDRHRKIMILYCQGWKMRDIALELNMPMGTVQNYIHKNKLKLRRLVA